MDPVGLGELVADGVEGVQALSGSWKIIATSLPPVRDDVVESAFFSLTSSPALSAFCFASVSIANDTSCLSKLFLNTWRYSSGDQPKRFRVAALYVSCVIRPLAVLRCSSTT